MSAHCLLPLSHPSSGSHHDMPFVSLQQIPVNCLLLTLSALEFYSLLPDKCQHKAMVIFAAFQTSQLSQVFRIQTPRYPCFPLSKDIAWPLLIPFALVRLTPTLMVSILMSFSYVLRNFLFSSLGSCCALFLACSSAHQKPSLLGADSFSFGNSPGSPPQPSLWALDGFNASLHRCLPIHHTLTRDTSCTTMSCYLPFIYLFTFLANFMSYVLEFPENTEHIFGILFCPAQCLAHLS